MINKTSSTDVKPVMAQPRAAQPFAGLTPDVVLDAAASVGLDVDGRLFALNSYENRVYQLGRNLGGSPGDAVTGHTVAAECAEQNPEPAGTDASTTAFLVLKFYRPGRWTDAQIEEEHRFTAELAQVDLPVAVPVQSGGRTLFKYREFRFAAFPWMAGRSPELDAPQARQILGRALGRVHQVGAVRPFQFRPRVGVQRLGWEARAQVLAGDLLPEALRARYTSVSGALLERVSAEFETIGPVQSIRIHGDCHLGNLLWRDGGASARSAAVKGTLAQAASADGVSAGLASNQGVDSAGTADADPAASAPEDGASGVSIQGPVFVDWDDCAMGPRVQDLWMLLSGSPSEQQSQWSELLEGYQQFADFDFREVRLIEPLRALRMLHHGAWVSHRWNDPAFPRAFPWFGEQRYWEGYLGDLLEQLQAIEDPPLLRV